VIVGKAPLGDSKVAAEEVVQFLYQCGLDVERQKLLCGFEIAQHLGMVLIPIVEPVLLEFSLGVSAFVGQGALLSRCELGLVVL